MYSTVFLLAQAVLSIWGAAYAWSASKMLERDTQLALQQLPDIVCAIRELKTTGWMPLWFAYRMASRAMARDAVLAAVSAVMAAILAADSVSDAPVARHDYVALLCAALLYDAREQPGAFWVVERVNLSTRCLTVVIWLWGGFGVAALVESWVG